MRKALIPILMATLAILLAGCDSGGKLRIINRTQHPLYATVEIDGEAMPVVLQGGEEYSFEVPTDTQSPFTGTVEAEVPVRLQGETFQIYDEDAQAYTDSTTVYVPAGKTLSVFADPNRAGIKIVNESSQAMSSAYIIRNNFVTDTTIALLGELAPGDSIFRCVDYATPNNNFYYKVSVQMADDSFLVYGNEDTVLLKDTVLRAVLADPTKKHAAASQINSPARSIK